MKVSCSICLEEMTVDSEVVSLIVCGHIFDAECITQYLLVGEKCPLCNAPTTRCCPPFKKVYFSVSDDICDPDNRALMDALAETDVIKTEINRVQKEYDDLAVKLTVVRDELNRANNAKRRSEYELRKMFTQKVLTEVETKRLYEELEDMKFKMKEEADKMALKLIPKQKAIDLLTMNLEISNNKIRLLKQEVDEYKYADKESVSRGTHHRSILDKTLESKYKNLSREHKTLKNNMEKLEKKFIELTLATFDTAPPPAPPPSRSEFESLRFRQLEDQLDAAKAKEQKFLKKVMNLNFATNSSGSSIDRAVNAENKDKE
ncbi:hypothetical protein BD408DRAFT_446543, partial [Parasitella parasitica]